MEPEGSSNKESSMSTMTNLTLTIRLIRSFKFKNWKPLVIRNCRLEMTWAELKILVDETIEKSSLPVPFRKDLKYYDAFKLETDPTTNAAKSQNALINVSTPVIKLDDGDSSNSSLESSRVRNEFEISLFNLDDYNDYVQSSDAL